MYLVVVMGDTKPNYDAELEIQLFHPNQWDVADSAVAGQKWREKHGEGAPRMRVAVYRDPESKALKFWLPEGTRTMPVPTWDCIDEVPGMAQLAEAAGEKRVYLNGHSHAVMHGGMSYRASPDTYENVSARELAGVVCSALYGEMQRNGMQQVYVRSMGCQYARNEQGDRSGLDYLLAELVELGAVNVTLGGVGDNFFNPPQGRYTRSDDRELPQAKKHDGRVILFSHQLPSGDRVNAKAIKGTFGNRFGAQAVKAKMLNGLYEGTLAAVQAGILGNANMAMVVDAWIEPVAKNPSILLPDAAIDAMLADGNNEDKLIQNLALFLREHLQPLQQTCQQTLAAIAEKKQGKMRKKVQQAIDQVRQGLSSGAVTALIALISNPDIAQMISSTTELRTQLRDCMADIPSAQSHQRQALSSALTQSVVVDLRETFMGEVNLRRAASELQDSLSIGASLVLHDGDATVLVTVKEYGAFQIQVTNQPAGHSHTFHIDQHGNVPEIAADPTKKSWFSRLAAYCKQALHQNTLCTALGELSGQLHFSDQHQNRITVAALENDNYRLRIFICPNGDQPPHFFYLDYRGQIFEQSGKIVSEKLHQALAETLAYVDRKFVEKYQQDPNLFRVCCGIAGFTPFIDIPDVPSGFDDDIPNSSVIKKLFELSGLATISIQAAYTCRLAAGILDQQLHYNNDLLETTLIFSSDDADALALTKQQALDFLQANIHVLRASFTDQERRAELDAVFQRLDTRQKAPVDDVAGMTERGRPEDREKAPPARNRNRRI